MPAGECCAQQQGPETNLCKPTQPFRFLFAAMNLFHIRILKEELPNHSAAALRSIFVSFLPSVIVLSPLAIRLLENNKYGKRTCSTTYRFSD